MPRVVHPPIRSVRILARLRGRDGFTLIEALVAFVVLALVMVAMQRLAVGNVDGALRAAERVEATRVAETLLSSRALGARGEPAEGRLENHGWSVRFEPVPLAAGTSGDIGARVFEPMRMIVTVQAGERRGGVLTAEAIRLVRIDRTER